MYPVPPIPERTPADDSALDMLSHHFSDLADRVQESIASGPMVGAPGSSWGVDFALESLDELALLQIGMKGALGLRQSIRGEARALQFLYRDAGPTYVGPAPFALMRGIWEKSTMLVWLLDGELPSIERVGRIRGWLNEGLRHMAQVDRHGDFSQWRGLLDDCPELLIRPPKWVHLASNFDALAGESIYRELSALAHGHSWYLSTAFTTAEDEGGQTVRWSAFPISLHHQYAMRVTPAALAAVDVVSAYFTGTTHGTPNTDSVAD